MTDILVLAAAVMLTIAGFLALARVVRGPSVLDRVVSSEVFVSVVVAALALEAAINRHSTTLPLLVSLSLLGFLGPVTVTRFMPRDVDPGTNPVPALPPVRFRDPTWPPDATDDVAPEREPGRPGERNES